MTTPTIETRLAALEARTDAAGSKAPANPVLIVRAGETLEEAALRQGGGPFLFAVPDNGRSP